MRHLGIDYGAKRVGLALSDEEGRIAFPYLTLDNAKKMLPKLAEILSKENVKKVVIGLPIPFSGKPSRQTEEVKQFAAKIKKITSIPVELENEILTTKLAARNGASGRNLDASSAALILQSYLDKGLGQNLRASNAK